MPDSTTRFSTLPPRQKASVIIFFLIGAFIIYEVIGLFRGHSSSSGEITPPTQTQAMTQNTPKPKPKPPITEANHQPGPQMPNTAPVHPNLPPPIAENNRPQGPDANNPILSKPIVAASIPDNSFLVQQDQAQNRYVSAINDLQMLKIQREIAETNQAITSAKLATVTAEKNISDMLAPEMEMPPTPKVSVPGPSAEVSFDTKQRYVVQSVSMEQDQWHAVISYKDKLFDVSVGDVLPTDGSTVTAIDPKGITLELGDLKQRLSLVTTDLVPEPTQGGNSAGGKNATSTEVAPQ